MLKAFERYQAKDTSLRSFGASQEKSLQLFNELKAICTEKSLCDIYFSGLLSLPSSILFGEIDWFYQVYKASISESYWNLPLAALFPSSVLANSVKSKASCCCSC